MFFQIFYFIRVLFFGTNNFGCCIHPQPFNIVILALFRMENMHKNSGKVKHDPTAFGIAFPAPLCKAP